MAATATTGRASSTGRGKLLPRHAHGSDPRDTPLRCPDTRGRPGTARCISAHRSSPFPLSYVSLTLCRPASRAVSLLQLPAAIAASLLSLQAPTPCRCYVNGTSCKQGLRSKRHSSRHLQVRIALGILVQLSRRHAHPPLFSHDRPSLPYPCPSSPLLPAPHSAAASRHQHRPSRPSRPPSPPPAGLLAGGRLPRPGRVGAGGGVRLLWPRVGPRPAGR